MAVAVSAADANADADARQCIAAGRAASFKY